jgi:hypothetical protein
VRDGIGSRTDCGDAAVHLHFEQLPGGLFEVRPTTCVVRKADRESGSPFDFVRGRIDIFVDFEFP